MDVIAAFLALTAGFAYLNARFLKLPMTIGVMAFALGISLLLVAINAAGYLPAVRAYEESLLRSVDFSELLMQGMLSFLLFAGALGVDLRRLRAFRFQVAALAIFGTALSTVLVGAALWWALPWVGLSLSLPHCLLFGALISPTDPIAVLGILKSAGAPEDLELVITSESLFNDGVGVVLFVLMLGLTASGTTPTMGEAGMLLLREAGGGILFGLALGFVGFRLMRSIDHYEAEVLITLAMVVGGYALASHLHVSGPLAMVVAGVLTGNQSRELAMSDETRHHVDAFWHLIDGILNAVLFVLIGMEVLIVPYDVGLLPAAILVIAVTLLARFLTAGLPVLLMHDTFGLPSGSWRVLSWSGLRGGISVALVLSLPAGEARSVLIPLTYCVVVFSILCQGLTIGTVVRHSIKPAA
ncbi:MAG: sodium:proton antiporter [Proteobacteria bacterium]|nr:sodium:proton antiporter [Pseudomonadota bacterium]MBK9252640.1 sodium:proton antiporter [Pseudomonadota bacterium]